MEEDKTKDEELGENLGNIFEDENFEDEDAQVIPMRRLYKIKKNSLISGVCTGIGHYFGIETIIIRVIFIISIFFGGWGIVAYFLAALLMPSEIKSIHNESEIVRENIYSKSITGSLFVFIGLYFIADNFGFTSSIFFLGFSRLLILPLILIATGVFLLLKIRELDSSISGIRQLRFFRSKQDRRLFGVCGGLAEYMNVESNNLRMIWIVFSFITIGIGFVLYIFISVLTKTQSEIEFEIQ